MLPNKETLNYIDTSIERAMEKARTVFKGDVQILIEKSRAEFKKDMERHTGALIEKYQDDMKILKELSSTKLDRGQVKEVVREELRPIERKLDIVVEEMKEHNREMRSLRTKSDSHDRRINALEKKSR